MKNIPAFPNNFTIEKFQGMTLRDYFASQAMQSSMRNFLAKDLDLTDPLGWMDGLASDAYQMADAMLKAREE